MMISIASIFACLKMQRAVRQGQNGWNGELRTLPEPQKSLIWFLAYMQTCPTVSMWLLCSIIGNRRYLDMIPLPPVAGVQIKKPCLYLGVSGIVNLCEEFEGYPWLYRRLGIEQCYLPTTDYCAVSTEHIAQGVEFIHRKIEAGDSVYVHCKSGVGRCATVLVTYLAKHKGMAVGEANRYARSFRKTIIGNVEHRPAVRAYLGLPAAAPAPAAAAGRRCKADDDSGGEVAGAVLAGVAAAACAGGGAAEAMRPPA